MEEKRQGGRGRKRNEKQGDELKEMRNEVREKKKRRENWMAASK